MGVEIKAIIILEKVHLAQAKNYVVAYWFNVHLLINYGATSIHFKKIVNSRFNPAVAMLIRILSYPIF